MRNKLIVALATWALPFLMVWASWILTFGAFNPYDVFGSVEFWGFSTIYWIIWVCVIGFVLEAME